MCSFDDDVAIIAVSKEMSLEFLKQVKRSSGCRMCATTTKLNNDYRAQTTVDDNKKLVANSNLVEWTPKGTKAAENNGQVK